MAVIEGNVPRDLVSFWAATGGGDLLESETILSPFGDPFSGDDVEGATTTRRERGLPWGWMIFHVGWGVSAFHLKHLQYAWFEGNLCAPSRTFDSLDAWYVDVLRAEFGGRYGL
jgi:hypothetical protein